MAGINIELPAFAPDDLNDPRARRRIVSYLYRLAEQVKYLSTHIDGENMTDDFQQEMISTASASVRDELSGTLTKFETQIEQNAREISTKASQTEVNALGEEIETASSEFSQTASQLSARVTTADGKASQALQTANGFSARITNAEGDIASLELSLSGVVASVEGNRLVFDSNGLTIKNAAGETVFFSSAITGTLNITGNINAAGGTIGGFTIGDNSITAPNGVKLYSSGNFSTVNNLQLSSGTDGHHRNYAMLTQASGFDELRIMHSGGDADWGSIRFYAENGQAKVSVHSPLTVGGGLLLINLPTTTQQPICISTRRAICTAAPREKGGILHGEKGATSAKGRSPRGRAIAIAGRGVAGSQTIVPLSRDGKDGAGQRNRGAHV